MRVEGTFCLIPPSYPHLPSFRSPIVYLWTGVGWLVQRFSASDIKRLVKPRDRAARDEDNDEVLDILVFLVTYYFV